LEEVIEVVEKDLGHYGYDVEERTSGIWIDFQLEGGKVLNAWIPCHLYKEAPESTAPLHLYDIRQLFSLPDTHFLPELMFTPSGINT
jgi:hypothetical protein